MERAAVGGVLVVVERGEHAVVPDQGAIADPDAALVLELAVGVDEDACSEMDVQPGVEDDGGQDGRGGH